MILGVVALVFRCDQAGGRLRLNGEVTAFQWATAGEIGERLAKAFAARVADAHHDGEPAVRAHDGTHLI